MFNTNSALVQMWVRNVRTENNPNGIYTREQVPKISNLQEMVYEVLDGE